MFARQELIARSSPLLESIPDHVVETLLKSAILHEFERGSTIYVQGELANAIYIVTEGWVKLYRISPSGSEAIMAVLPEGASFGGGVPFGSDNHQTSAEAATDTKVLVLPISAITTLLGLRPELTSCVLSAVLSVAMSHMNGLLSQVEQLKAQTGAQRLAEFLVRLASRSHGSCDVILPYDKALIAGHLGLKPESLSRALAKLREYGVVVKHNHARINDVAKLRELVDEDPARAWTKK